MQAILARMSHTPAPAPTRRARMVRGLAENARTAPLTVVAAAVVLAVTVLWGLVELPRLMVGVLGPAGFAQGLDVVLVVVVLTTVPSMVEVVALVALVLRRSWCWIPLTALVLWYAASLVASGPSGPVAPLVLTVVPLVLVLLPPSRAWFRSRRTPGS